MTKLVLGFGLFSLALTGVLLAQSILEADSPKIERSGSAIFEPSEDGARVAELEASWVLERAALERLQEELAGLQRRVAALERQEPPAADSAALTTSAVASNADAGAEPVAAPTRPDETALVAAGFPAAEVRAYRARVDEIALRRLYLADQARREGWFGSDHYREESAALFRELRSTRDEFGDDLYDWTLFGSGQANRVRVAEVMQNSPADAAGLETGDVLLRYADERVLSPSDLRELTSEGRPGETTAVDVQRGEDAVRLYLPRGPLGIQIEPLRIEPQVLP